MDFPLDYLHSIAQRLYNDNYKASRTEKELHERLQKQGFDEITQSRYIKALVANNIIFPFNSANPPVIYKLREDIARGFIHHN